MRRKLFSPLQGLSWIPRLYDRVVLRRPVISILFLTVLFAALISGVQFFRLDASADSLVLEGDLDYKKFVEIVDRYGTTEFALITFTPKTEVLFSEDSLRKIDLLQQDLAEIPHIKSVVSMLDVPLFKNPPVPIKELKSNIKTLRSELVDLAMAREEFTTSPIFPEYLISKDGQSSALMAVFEPDETLSELSKVRNRWRAKACENKLTRPELKNQADVETRYRARKKSSDALRHETITNIRRVLSVHQDSADFCLGGIPMIADDMLTFVRGDLKTFGMGILLFLLFTLGFIFRRWRWVLLPMLCCILSVLVMMGLLGIFRWDVTVVSSNFISLQMIMTMALTIHIIVRYTELMEAHPEYDRFALVSQTVRSIFMPCFYTMTTTIAGFSSLVFCDLLPVINFGWMMTVGLVVSLLVTFFVLPSVLMLLPDLPHQKKKPFGEAVTHAFASFTQHHRWIIGGVSIIVLALTVTGTLRLRVENSFINYFKKNTEIHKGMTFVDQQLGGTTPLDVLIDFEDIIESVVSDTSAAEDSFFDDFDEFETAEDEEKYWYTLERMRVIEKIHTALDVRPEVGKILSLHTVVEMAKWLNDGKELGVMGTTLLFSQLPEDFRALVLDPYVSIEDNQARISIRIKDSMKDLRRDQLLKDIRKEFDELLADQPETAQLAGTMVLYNNMLQSLFSSQFQTIGITVAAILIMFLLFFRSVVISIIALVPNLIASLSVLGVMGLAGLPLDMMTITIVAISVGIAVDNTIHYIHRFRHELEQDNDYIAAMYRSHASIGRAMYYTSFTIVAGFSILAFSNFIPTVLFGLFTGLAIAMALFAALLLLPLLIIIFKPFGK